MATRVRRTPEEVRARDERGRKHCIRCGEWRPEHDFSPGRNSDGLFPYCNHCGPTCGTERGARVAFSLRLTKTFVRGGDGLACIEAYAGRNDKGCWLWPGHVNRDGYGRYDDRARFGTHLAHRITYLLANGSIDPNLSIHHKCAVRSCVRPAHLQQVTLDANHAEMLERQGYLRKIRDLEARLDACRCGGE